MDMPQRNPRAAARYPLDRPDYHVMKVLPGRTVTSEGKFVWVMLESNVHT
jgi:hypothetical protein